MEGVNIIRAAQRTLTKQSVNCIIFSKLNCQLIYTKKDLSVCCELYGRKTLLTSHLHGLFSNKGDEQLR